VAEVPVPPESGRYGKNPGPKNRPIDLNQRWLEILMQMFNNTNINAIVLQQSVLILAVPAPF
jgi:hypothetical protein